jgi:phenylalanyl-tRNA synthetase beta chain
MKVSLNWLREMVDLPPTVDALVDLLTLAGVEVEGVETRGCDIPNVIVAQIKTSEQHPNADRLSVCQVDDGSEVTRQIVCGAKNYKIGDKVPLALPGAKLGPDFTIKVGKLRGIESQGMMCSAKELALAEDAEGLLILPQEARVGAPIGELFPGDTVLDLEITPNRPDLLSHYGIAREIAALTGATLRTPALELRGEAAGLETVRISTAACPFYSARRIDGVKVGPSPEWLRRKLEAAGLRPINNLVDVTNYVMLELGEPLHAFDAAKLRGALRVRGALPGERFLALDGRTYELREGDVVIADAERAVAIGGVMGGEETGVNETTTTIWLEAAEFAPAQIRRTSRRLGLVSDSSYRFERGIDPEIVLYASQRAAELIVATAGGSAAEAIHVGCYAAEEELPGFGQPVSIHFPGAHEAAQPANDKRGVIVVEAPGAVHSHWTELRHARLEAVLGTQVAEERAAEILTRFGLKRSEGRWLIPSFRKDLAREVDLIEEVARVIGMEVIPARTAARFVPASATDRAYDRAMELRRAFVALGLHEARSLTLVPDESRGLAFTQTSPTSLVRVKNPMIDDQVVMRPGLIHGLLSAVAHNVRAGVKSIRLFEIGRVFSRIEPEEFSHAALVLSGPLVERSWRAAEGRDADLFDLKGVIAAALGDRVTFERGPNSALALSLTIQFAGQCVGFAGQLWPADARALDGTAPVVFAEIDLDALDRARGPGVAARKHREIPHYPASARDVALIAPLDLAHERIAATLCAANEPLLASVELFDVFSDPTGARVPAGNKSLAYSLTYRAPDRTLTAEEVNAAHARLKARLTSELGVTLRE